MLGTLLEASGPGQSWPSLRDARALVTGGLRVRGWTWSLSMLWVVAGTVGTGYDFYITTKPYTWADVSLGIEGWSADPEAVRIAVVLATAASLALPIPALIAGFIRLRGWRARNWLRTGAWAGAWIAGFAQGACPIRARWLLRARSPGLQCPRTPPPRSWNRARR